MSSSLAPLSSTDFATRLENWHRWPTQRIGEALQARGVHPEDEVANIPPHLQRAGRFVLADLSDFDKEEFDFLRIHVLARRRPDKAENRIITEPIIYPGIQAIYKGGKEDSKIYAMQWEPVRLTTPPKQSENDNSVGTSAIARDTAGLFCAQFCACPDSEVGSLFEASYGTAQLRVNHFDFRSPRAAFNNSQQQIAEKLPGAKSIILSFGESAPFRNHPFRIRPILEIIPGTSKELGPDIGNNTFEYSVPCPPFCGGGDGGG